MTPVERIVFPLDVPDMASARAWVARLREHVGMFKVGLELFLRCGPDVVRYIREETGVPVFLDLKLHDIPVTVGRAVSAVKDLDVRFLTVHADGAERMLAQAVAASEGLLGILGVTVLTSTSPEDLVAGGIDPELAVNIPSLVIRRAHVACAAGCEGVVCSPQEAAMLKKEFGDRLQRITPGVRPEWSPVSGDDQHRTMTPAEAIAAGADYLVIGRPIRDAANPVAAAIRVAEEIAGQ